MSSGSPVRSHRSARSPSPPARKRGREGSPDSILDLIANPQKKSVVPLKPQETIREDPDEDTRSRASRGSRRSRRSPRSPVRPSRSPPPAPAKSRFPTTARRARSVSSGSSRSRSPSPVRKRGRFSPPPWEANPGTFFDDRSSSHSSHRSRGSHASQKSHGSHGSRRSKREDEVHDDKPEDPYDKYLRKAKLLRKLTNVLGRKCRFDMDSDIREMEMEFARVSADLEAAAGVSFYRNGLVSMVTGIELIQNHYGFYGINLNGWSQNVTADIQKFDGTLERLYEKYSGGSRWPPEIELLMGLAGSAVMFHISSKLIGPSAPAVREMLRSNPDMLSSIQNMLGAPRGVPAAQGQPMVPPPESGAQPPKASHDPRPPPQPFPADAFGLQGLAGMAPMLSGILGSTAAGGGAKDPMSAMMSQILANPFEIIQKATSAMRAQRIPMEVQQKPGLVPSESAAGPSGIQEVPEVPEAAEEPPIEVNIEESAIDSALKATRAASKKGRGRPKKAAAEEEGIVLHL